MNKFDLMEERVNERYLEILSLYIAVCTGI